MFLGTTFFSGERTISPTITNIDDCTYINVRDCLLEELYASNDMDVPLEIDTPREWTYNTIIHALYNSDLTGGNVNYNLENTSHIVIKRREKGTFNWNVVLVKEINSYDDFTISGVDKFARAKTVYEYATVPYLNGVPGNYNITEVESDFDGIFIVGHDEMYGTYVKPGTCDTVRNVPNTFVAPINSRYRRYIRNNSQDYQTGNASGIFLVVDDCEVSANQGYSYRQSIMDFLADGRAKLLKHYDGREWIINVDNAINDSMDGDWRIREISFDWEEVGDPASDKDLYNTGLSDISADWWAN